MAEEDPNIERFTDEDCKMCSDAVDCCLDMCQMKERLVNKEKVKKKKAVIC